MTLSIIAGAFLGRYSLQHLLKTSANTCGCQDYPKIWIIPILGFFIRLGLCPKCRKNRDYRFLLSEVAGASLGFLVYRMIFPETNKWIIIATILFFIMFFLNVMTDIYIQSMVPAAVFGMFILSFIPRTLVHEFLPMFIFAILVILVYVFIYLYQRSIKIVDTSKWDFEVKGFGSADVLLVCSLANIFGLFNMGLSMVFGAILYRFLYRYMRYTGLLIDTSEELELYPYCAMGMAIYLAFRLLLTF